MMKQDYRNHLPFYSGGHGKPESFLDEGRVGLLRALALSAPCGDFVEVGVYRGGSAWHLMDIARTQMRRVHLFDTFTGMPHAHHLDQFREGDLADTSLESVRSALPGALIYPGVFPGTWPTLAPVVAFVHVDCDQYQSYLDCIDVLWPLLVRGGAMLFDDYPDLEGATRAVNERMKGSLIEVPLDPRTPAPNLRSRFYARKEH
jgi:Macrocin-O-methyltransferase (TylF)